MTLCWRVHTIPTGLSSFHTYVIISWVTCWLVADWQCCFLGGVNELWLEDLLSQLPQGYTIQSLPKGYAIETLSSCTGVHGILMG